jgi:hypothetical protein
LSEPEEPELGGVELLGEEAPPLVPEAPADGDDGELLPDEPAPGVPAADGLEEPDVPIVVEFFELLELLPLVDGVEEPEVPVVDGLVADDFAGVDGLVADDFAGGAELPLEEEPLLSQAARASTPSAALVIKKNFRMYSPPEPKGCTRYRLRKPE